ncbi:DNA adenine methylase [Thioflexithrix psekupsensis]|uniref:site-specific DNA-methyltransferase (adenine-specific) n=1 Tax=Thioflexithrix psekupsensis TaxID=1570016 RepID=A0A251X5Z4_9GAMM|nr:DNA adenine methylase [Thioflexithrix psekupsensis]OUD12930.1 modification methylase [Thioflexithrix psekupsensis]
MAKPFLKWAGGKAQLLKQFESYYPKELHQGEIEQYIEPFIGGGAVFFALMQRFPIQYSLISDVNVDLILTYQVIQQQPEQLVTVLAQYQQQYRQLSEEKRSQFFYATREQFNTQSPDQNRITKAAQFIFLNKTCFNGLFRLNAKGQFNVPFGRYKNPTILDEANIFAVSGLLQRTEIKLASYQDCFSVVNDRTLVYFDPPYRPVSKTAHFTTYSGSIFTDKAQLELASFFKKLDVEKKAKLMLSNSDPKNENKADHFFDHLYADYRIHRVTAHRMINCQANKRGQINELLITNY